MYARPAGMSDDEDNDEGFSFADEVPDEYDRYKKTDYIVTKTEPVIASNNLHLNNTEEWYEVDIVNALKFGRVDIIQKYFENHNVNELLQEGWTPLLYASMYAQADIVQYLLKHGAKANKHKDGFTPLMAVCSSAEPSTEKCIKCLKLLLNSKANANTYNKNQETALMLACQSKDIELIVELLPYVKYINACDHDGRTALMYAVIANKPDVVQLLLQKNANPEIPDRYNRTVMDIAAHKDYKEILRLLKDEAEEVQTICEISNLHSWRDMFPTLNTKNDYTVNCDIASMLRGMSLSGYMHLFNGMDLSRFLQLTEEDLINLGIDISFHRKQFMDCLHRFHTKKWTIASLGATNKSDSYTIYNGVLTLGMVAKQLDVIESSFRYVKNNIGKPNEKQIYFTPEEKLDYDAELEKTQKKLLLLKQELLHIKSLAKKIDKYSDKTAPPSYIGPKHYTANGTVILSITIMVGIFLSQNAYMSWLWKK